MEVTDEEVDDWVERLRERFAELSRWAVRSSRGLRDRRSHGHARRRAGRTGVAGGLPVLRRIAEVGEKLDVELVGGKAGAMLKVSDSLPGRFGEELGGAVVEIAALVKDVKARRLPELDDAFAKTASEFDTIQQLRDDLRERLTEVKEREATASSATSPSSR